MPRAHVVHVDHDTLLQFYKKSPGEQSALGLMLVDMLLGMGTKQDPARLATYGVIHVGSTEATAPPPSPDAIAPPPTPQPGYDVEPGVG